jgi:hypothetical protein
MDREKRQPIASDSGSGTFGKGRGSEGRGSVGEQGGVEGKGEEGRDKGEWVRRAEVRKGYPLAQIRSFSR